MGRAAEILEADKDTFARLMTLEMGKPLAAARAEAAKCATACRYYVEHAERLLADEPVDTGGGNSYVRYQPIGAGAGGDAVEFSVLAGLPLRWRRR